MKNTLNHEKPEHVHHMLKTYAPVQLIDVRTEAEFAQGHAKGARSIPLNELSSERLRSKLGAMTLDSQKLYFICEAGDRARQAVNLLQDQGLSDTVVVEGGTKAWRESGLPVKRLTNLPSLEQQTQIAIGVLLLVLLTKGLLIHPLFYALIGMIGIGLITAGVTAKCTLSMLLARMPWNRIDSKSLA